MTPTRPRRHNYGLPVTLQAGLELDFRRAVRQVPRRQRPQLRAWLRRYRRHRSRTFHHLDPATDHWRRA